MLGIAGMPTCEDTLFMVFIIPLILDVIPSKIPLITSITKFITPFAIAPIPSKSPLKTFTIPFPCFSPVSSKYSCYKLN